MRTIILLISIIMMSACDTQTVFTSKRVQRSATFKVDAPIEVVFPLFGPIKEKLWAEGWNPEIIYSTTNDVEERMIFKTHSSHNESEPYTWVVTQYQPDNFFVEYMVSTSQRIWFIRVECKPFADHTKVNVTYTYTGLTEEGNQLNERALIKMYAHNLSDWEQAINKYLSESIKSKL